jgi:hypothetical protein
MCTTSYLGIRSLGELRDSPSHPLLKRVERKSPGYDLCTAILRRYVNHFCPFLHLERCGGYTPSPKDKAYPLSPHFSIPQTTLSAAFPSVIRSCEYVGASLFEAYLLDRHRYLRHRYSPSSLGHKCSDENQISPYPSECLTKFKDPHRDCLKFMRCVKFQEYPAFSRLKCHVTILPRSP